MLLTIGFWNRKFSKVFVIWAATWQNQKNECAPSEDSDQPGHPPSLTRFFAVCMNKPWVLSYHWAHSKDSDQTDMSLRWAHSHFVGFIMSRLIYGDHGECDPDHSYTLLLTPTNRDSTWNLPTIGLIASETISETYLPGNFPDKEFDSSIKRSKVNRGSTRVCACIW